MMKMNIRRHKKLLTCFIICFFVTIFACIVSKSTIQFAYAETYQDDIKYSCNATISDDFADNRIIVAMNYKEVNNIDSYSGANFSEIPILQVNELSHSTDAKKCRYRAILCLLLQERNKQDVLNYIKILERRNDVICAEPDYLLTSNNEPNDENYQSNDMWGLKGENGINAPAAWNVTTGSKTIRVGVIDSGIDSKHEDLKNRVNRNLSYDFSSDSATTGAFNDTYGHGTHVAGTIGAQGNNSIGVTGVNWDIDLVSLKINEGGSTSYFASKLISVVNYAIEKNIQVLNNSNSYSEVANVNNSLDLVLESYDGLFINSAGNKNKNLDVDNYLPESASLPNVLVVGATTEIGTRWSSSNYSSNNVHIYAPGSRILSTVPKIVDISGYSFYSGTSMAAPHVSGVAALLLSIDPTLTGAELKSIILNSADTIKIDKGVVKKLNAYNAVRKIGLETDIFNTTNLSNNEIRIDGLKSDCQGTLEIPRFINNRKVTQIKAEAFSGYTGITGIIIPNTIESIGNSAFMNCTTLQNVSLEGYSNLNYINGYAFQQCLSLKSLTIPSSVKNVEWGISSFGEKLTYYTDLSSDPSTWDAHWNKADWISIQRPVVWGCKLSADNSYVVSLSKTTSSITKPNAVNGISAPYRKGYTFAGWYKNADFTGTAISAANIATAANNVIYYAKWIPACDIVFDTNGGTSNNYVETVQSGSMVKKPLASPIKSGYVFKYWALSSNLNQEYNWNASVTDNIVLKAVWQAVDNDKVVTFNLNGGEGNFNAQITVASGATASRPSSPTKVGYTFSCWALSGQTTAYNFNTPVTSDITLVAIWQSAQTRRVTFDTNGGEGNFPTITVNQYGSIDKPTTEPVKAGNYFKYWALSTNLNQEYSWNSSVSQNITLTAVWESFNRTVSFDANGGSFQLYALQVNVGDTVGEFLNNSGISNPTRANYKFKYWALSTNTGSAYNMNTPITNSITLKAIWQINTYTVSFNADGGSGSYPNKTIQYGSTVAKPADPSKSGYTFKYWALSGQTTAYDFSTPVTSNLSLVAIWEENSCIAAGTLITLADGRQVPVESLTGNEMLLVWNLHTGTFGSASILFIDSDEAKTYEIINLYFSDGTNVKVITEHAFWDYNLNQYVFLRNDAEQYLGHWFNKQTINATGDLISTRVQLTSVEITYEYTTAWSPVTYGYLCYYVNGMLSMPGATEGFINIFDVDAQTMKYDESAMASDIEEYGLFTYEEFADLYPIPETIFDAFGGQYLKISLGKGLISSEDLASLIDHYASFLVG